MKSLSLYLHFPFCVRKCRYCDFLSGPGTQEVRQEYIRALLKEIGAYRGIYKERRIDTVYFGGGTPSLLSAADMGRVMDCLRDNFHILPEAEITAEVNPGTVTMEKLQSYHRTGINRLSIGIQSFMDRELRLLGRIHTAEEAEQTYISARKAGFENISLDLMGALPGQTSEDFRYSLERARRLEPEHLSVYSLIIEEGTPFAQMELPPLPEEEADREMYHFTRRFLKDAGYERYEISNYARQGKESIHNMGYWNGHDYLGLGTGAASRVGRHRFSNIREMESYIRDSGRPELLKREEEFLTVQDEMEEFMFLGLRLTKGIREEDFFRKFNKRIDTIYGSIIKKQVEQKLICREGGRIFLTAYGTDISNRVMADYLF